LALFSKRRRWLEWVVIALVLGWIGAIAWRHSVERDVAPPEAERPIAEQGR
jgi:hypothetical protein